MPSMHVSLALTALSFLVVPSLGNRPLQVCDGCEGEVGSASATGGSCPGASLTIDVTVAEGTCKWLGTADPPDFHCTQTKGCKPTVTTSWENLPQNSVETCIVLPAGEWCKTDSGSGTGGVTHESPALNCKGNSNPVSFTASVAGCGALSASVDVVCTKCQ